MSIRSNAEYLRTLGGPGSGPHKGGGSIGHDSAAKLHKIAGESHANLIGKSSSASSKEANTATAVASAATKSLAPVDGPVAISAARNASSESTKGNHANAAEYHTTAMKEHQMMAQKHREFDARQKK